MPKTVNAICKQLIKVKKSYKISAMFFSSSEFSVCVFAPDTLCRKELIADFISKNFHLKKQLFLHQNIGYSIS